MEPEEIKLTADDLRQIESWYLSAAGESTTQEPALRALLKKLGFKPHFMDESYVTGIPND